MLEEGQKKYIAWTLFLILGIIWGSSFILMKKALFTANGEVLLLANEVALLRIVFAMLSLLPIVFLKLRKIKRTYWKYLFIVGFFGNGIPAFLFAHAQTQVSSSIAGILNSTVPIFTLILGTLLFSFKSSNLNRIGVLIGFLGSAIIIVGGQLDFKIGNFLYPSLILIATFCYAISTNTIKRYLKAIKAIEITAFGLFTIGFPAAIYLAFSSIPARVMENPDLIDGVIYTLILAIASTSFALILYNYLIKMATALFASSVTYLIPFVAVIWGWIDGERLSLLQLSGGVVLLIGVGLIYRKENSV